MKRVLSFLLALSILCSLFIGVEFSAYAADTKTGSCGENVTYSFDDNTGTLTLSGAGNMYDGYPEFTYNEEIKAVVVDDGVTSIGAYAFSECGNLTSVAIGGTVMSIGDNAFYNCTSLAEVDLPAGLVRIGDNAFDSCCSLTNMNIPDSVIYIGKLAFCNCDSLISVDIPNGITTIGDSVFSGCHSLKTVNIPSSVTSIDDGAFDGCSSLTDVTLPNGVTHVGEAAFYGCGLTHITIPTSITSIERSVFENCSELESVTIPKSVTKIGGYAFQNCSGLTSITIPDGVTEIGEYAFYDCEFESVTLPNSVISIGERAFDLCPLDKVVILNPNTKLGENFLEENVWPTIYGFKNSTAAKYADKYGKDFIEIYCNYYGMEHAYKKSVIKKATCENSGEVRYTCSRCYQSYTEITPALGGEHNYKTDIVKKPTCTTDGTLHYTCVLCGQTKTETIPAEGHKFRQVVQSATAGTDGNIIVKCSECGRVTGKTVIAKASNIKLSKTAYTYNGKVQKPSVTVKDSKGKTLKRGTDYTVSYSSGSKNVGRYTVKVTLKGNYSGTKSLTYNINPKGTSISKITAAKKGFKVTWKKQATQTTGYQVQYSTSSKFKSAKTVTISKNKTISKSVSKLSAKKKYYVRVRTYKTVKVNGKNVKLYSGWSKAKSVTTKK